jgi:hypothetical protein
MNTGLNIPSPILRCLPSGSYLCHLWLKRIGTVWANGGLGRMHELFGERMDALIEELNKELTA